MSFEIIDFHTHPFLESADNFNFHTEVMELSAEKVKNDLERAGISTFCGSILKAKREDFSFIRQSNRDALKLRDIYGGCYIPGFTINPNFVEKSIEEIDFAHKNGVNLIGELVPYYHGWEDYANDNLSVLLDHIAEYSMVVSVHSQGLDRMEMMAKAHPDINFVFAHPGEKNTVLEHIAIMKKCDNVYLDLSGTGIFRYGVIKRLVCDVGAERILFGTDYPICNPQAYVGGVMGEDITDTEKELIFAGNAKRILGI